MTHDISVHVGVALTAWAHMPDMDRADFLMAVAAKRDVQTAKAVAWIIRGDENTDRWDATRHCGGG